ncbi:hypothetical protein M6G63_25495 (plasmid) [Pseudomonas sp. BYT-5]|uniref:hypothetical protein n=1 Tax=Pseudomonas sp. BYT-5 TaxID=2944392 RepID=UPI002021E1DE|nr:hypothetical protein [Pseudomonas sp. BYT-5]URD45381.1 hypothetical protein M6G63_25495 [Pseudomonas sp. BYT-5]
MKFVFAYTTGDFSEALSMIGQSPERLASMVTGIFSLDRVGHAFDAFGNGAGQIKVLVKGLVAITYNVPSAN